MHGLINRGLQSFVLNIYGADAWQEICVEACLPFQNFETMLAYDDLYTEQVLDAASTMFQRARADLLEDFGTFLVSEHCSPAVRKLLRLGGQDYVQFLQSLDDVYDRVSISIPDLDMPLLQLTTRSDSDFILHYQFNKSDYGAVFLGLLRAMADDYECLATIQHQSKMLDGIDRDIFKIQLYSQNHKAA